MLRLKPCGLGNQVRDWPKCQTAYGAGEHKVHMLQGIPRRLQAGALLPQQGQSSGGILPLETAADILQRRARLTEDGNRVKS